MKIADQHKRGRRRFKRCGYWVISWDPIKDEMDSDFASMNPDRPLKLLADAISLVRRRKRHHPNLIWYVLKPKKGYWQVKYSTRNKRPSNNMQRRTNRCYWCRKPITELQVACKECEALEKANRWDILKQT